MSDKLPTAFPPGVTCRLSALPAFSALPPRCAGPRCVVELPPVCDGSSSGLGRNIAEAALAFGDRLVTTARDPRRLENLMKDLAIRFVPLPSVPPT